MIYAKLKKFLQIFGGFAEWYTFQCESGTVLNDYIQNLFGRICNPTEQIIVTYNNGTIIQCQFKEKEEVVDFLERIK